MRPIAAETPKRPKRPPVAVYVLAGVVVGGLGLWGIQEIWTLAGELDAKPPRHGLKQRLMERKADAMHDLLDAMVEGKLAEVHEAAAEIEASAEGIEAFLSTDMYQEHGAEFFDAVQAVQRAANEGDLKAAKDATLALERSCLDCHVQLNEAVDAGRWR